MILYPVVFAHVQFAFMLSVRAVATTGAAIAELRRGFALTAFRPKRFEARKDGRDDRNAEVLEMVICLYCGSVAAFALVTYKTRLLHL
jgi:hypothetical protein